jgi:uncharacterized glyoxalase superfamily protein PhnB
MVMIRLCKPQFVVESVEKAVKFYTEKLGFDILDLVSKNLEEKQVIIQATMKKGKCIIVFRRPKVGEMAEMSMIKHCVGRGAGILVEIKKDLEVFFDKIGKKNVSIGDELKRDPEQGIEFFSIKDPFGLKVVFYRQTSLPGTISPQTGNFCGIKSFSEDLKAGQKDSIALDIIATLKTFGILKRASKKFAKLWLKEATK